MTSLRFDSALVPPSVRWMLREEPLEAAWSMSMGVEDIVYVGVPSRLVMDAQAEGGGGGGGGS